MRRRELMALLGSATFWPLATRAQQKGMPQVGFLSIFCPPANPADLLRGPVHQGMGELGFVDGQSMCGNTAGRISILIGCLRWPPTWSAVRST